MKWLSSRRKKKQKQKRAVDVDEKTLHPHWMWLRYKAHPCARMMIEPFINWKERLKKCFVIGTLSTSIVRWARRAKWVFSTIFFSLNLLAIDVGCCFCWMRLPKFVCILSVCIHLFFFTSIAVHRVFWFALMRFILLLSLWMSNTTPFPVSDLFFKWFNRLSILNYVKKKLALSYEHRYC